MNDLKTKRDPMLPGIPSKHEWQQYDRIEQWRRSNLTVMRQLHNDTYDDFRSMIPSVQQIFCYTMDQISGTWDDYYNSDFLFLSAGTVGGIGNKLNANFMLAKGTYTIMYVYNRANSFGIIDFCLNGNLIDLLISIIVLTITLIGKSTRT